MNSISLRIALPRTFHRIRAANHPITRRSSSAAKKVREWTKRLPKGHQGLVTRMDPAVHMFGLTVFTGALVGKLVIDVRSQISVLHERISAQNSRIVALEERIVALEEEILEELD